jgi:hypothetical protein
VLPTRATPLSWFLSRPFGPVKRLLEVVRGLNEQMSLRIEIRLLLLDQVCRQLLAGRAAFLDASDCAFNFVRVSEVWLTSFFHEISFAKRAAILAAR